MPEGFFSTLIVSMTTCRINHDTSDSLKRFFFRLNLSNFLYEVMISLS